MNWLKTLVLILAMILAFLFAALAVNQQEVALTFAKWQTPMALPIFWWLLAAFIIGWSFGGVISIWINIKHRLSNRKLQKNLTQVTAELERLRALSAEG